MQSPHYPTYGKQGIREPAESITDLNRSTALLENLRELQKYSEKLAYESLCCRLWAEGIQTQIKDEQDRLYQWIEGMTEDLLRAKRASMAQPHWMPPMMNPLPPSCVFQLSIDGAGQASSIAQESFYGISPIHNVDGPMGRSQDEAAALEHDIHERLRDVQCRKSDGIQLRCELVATPPPNFV